jgi:DNA-binding NtrC family response regulator
VARSKILITDDDRLLQKSLQNVLSEKYDTAVVGTGEAAVDYLKKNETDLVLLDIKLPGIDGIETLKVIRANEFEVAVIMITAYEDIKSVISAMKMGALDYLVKPLDIEELEIIIERSLHHIQMRREIEELRSQMMQEYDISNIVSQSPAMKMALKMVNLVKNSPDTTVLIEGETGTGKEVIAKLIHYGSERIGGPLVTINCGAISSGLVESELFGYEDGTFTGGLKGGKKGKFELAEGGTLFLDEIAEMPLASQVKLLRFLDDKEFYKVGGTEKKQVDVRIIAATNRNLIQCVKEKTFREDLYYRLNVAKITIDPLRKRKEDIFPLVTMFMKKYNIKFGRNFTKIAHEAKQTFLEYPWPGNVRELKNAIERIVLMENDGEIKLPHLWFLDSLATTNELQSFHNPLMLESMDLNEINKNLVQKALTKTGGNKTQAAKLLGISRSSLLYRLKKIEDGTNNSF